MGSVRLYAKRWPRFGWQSARLDIDYSIEAGQVDRTACFYLNDRWYDSAKAALATNLPSSLKLTLPD